MVAVITAAAHHDAAHKEQLMNNIEELSKPVGFVGLEGFSLLADGCLGVISPNLAFGEAPVYSQEYVEALVAQLEAAQKLNPLSVNVSELEATYIGDIRLHMAAISDWKSRAEKAEAALSAAQKERDALREVHIGAGSNTRAAADIYFQLIEELEVPAGGSLVGVIDNLKAELSAANERVSREYPATLPCPVLLEPGLRLGKGLPIAMLFRALSRRADYEAEIVAMTPEQRAEHDQRMREGKEFISECIAPRLAGFTVEGNADA
ncbi:Uncharacterised protein [Yersinia kristensenii]|nr:Uncharacterised protein [Yersinia kristensenii]